VLVRILRRFWRGWAVAALFGRTTRRGRALFPIITGAAIAWPLLLIGIAIPKPLVQMVALIPVPEWVPSMDVRIVWMGLALLIPLAVGATVTWIVGPQPGPGYVARVLRGFPLTIGLAVAFACIFLSVPAMTIVSLLRRQRSADIPLIMDGPAYADVAIKVADVLRRHGFVVRTGRPGWWVTMPIRLLGRMGGQALGSHLPDRLEHFQTGDLTITLYPSGVVLRGKRDRLSWAHGLIAEAVVYTEGLQTSDARAQALEERLRPLWKHHHDGLAGGGPSPELSSEIQPIAEELRNLQVDWDDWQILYRQILQLDRVLQGRRQLLDAGMEASVRRETA
jgi:hypothetical protein